jgi:methyltransferase family protein
MRLGSIPGRITRKLKFMSIPYLTIPQRAKLWPAARQLEGKHVRSCKLFENRDAMLEQLPPRSVCAEIGIDKSLFSEKILSSSSPAKLHLIDICPAAVENARVKFAPQIAHGTVETHLGDSVSMLNGLPDEYFDWVYVDGNHSYEGVKRDLEAALPKLKPNGLLALNDYIFFAASEFVKYGVVEAVNEFCVSHNFEFVYFALQGRMHNDVVLARIGYSTT